MKIYLIALVFTITAISSGCYSNTTKDSGASTTDQSAPMPSRSGRY